MPGITSVKFFASIDIKLVFNRDSKPLSVPREAMEDILVNRIIVSILEALIVKHII